jgi:hypothetical protein
MSSVDEEESAEDEEGGGPSLAEEDDVQGQVPLPGDEDEGDEGVGPHQAGRDPGE